MTTLAYATPSMTPSRELTLKDIGFLVPVCLILFSEMASQFLPSALTGAMDHGIVMGTFAFVFAKRTAQGRIHLSDLSLIILMCSLIFLSLQGAYSGGVKLAIVSTILIVKIGYVSTAFSVLSRARVLKLINWLACFQVTGLVLNVAFPSVFAQFSPEVYAWLAKTDIMGLQLNVNRFGILGALLFVWFVYLRPNVVMAGLMLASILLSESRSALILLVLFVGYFWVQGSFRRLVFACVAASAMALPLYPHASELLVKAGDMFEKVATGDTYYIRAIMFAGGYFFAAEHFPFGTGGGMFGSPLSKDSITYTILGIADLPTVVEGHGINDSGVGSILGEYGFAGAFIILLTIGGIFHGVFKGQLTLMDILFLLFVLIVGSLFRAMISSYYYAIVILLLGVMLSIRRDQRRAKIVR